MLVIRRACYNIFTMLTARQHNYIRNLSAIVICACILIASTLIDWVIIFDRFAGFDFEPTAAMTSLKNDLDLSTRANIIFSATHPTIKDGNDFNRACSAVSREVSVLGCYDGQHIFIYNVTHPELEGIQQSTLAHELLHAIWDRLPDSTQDSISVDLDAIYEANIDRLKPRLDLYPDDSFFAELHSIIGTEFINLPDRLEVHYARYFNDQNRVVSFYDQYATKFEKLRTEAEALFAQIAINKELIEAKVANYNDAVTELSAAITDFNRRAEGGYFTSVAAFNAERATLIAQQQKLEQLHGEITALEKETNALIEKYNDNFARTQILLDSINSNATPTPEV